jgi:hypothetical protein
MERRTALSKSQRLGTNEATHTELVRSGVAIRNKGTAMKKIAGIAAILMLLSTNLVFAQANPNQGATSSSQRARCNVRSLFLRGMIAELGRGKMISTLIGPSAHLRARTLARLQVIPCLPAFLAEHLGLDVDVLLDDRDINLIETGNVALRTRDPPMGHGAISTPN